MFSDDPDDRRGESRISLLLLVMLLVVPIFGGLGVLLLAALTAFVPGLLAF
jgi:hypothetical protein